MKVHHLNCGSGCPLLGRFVAKFGLLHGAGAHEFEQPHFQAEMGFPEFTVVHAFDAFPDAGFGAVLLPGGAQMAVVQAEHLGREP